MPDILILTPDRNNAKQLTSIAEMEQFRVKQSHDFAQGLSWSSSQPFDVVLVDRAFAKEKLDKLADSCWSMNKSCPLIIFNLGELLGISQERLEYGLIGADYIEGSDSLDKISAILQRLKEKKSKSSLGFEILVVEDLDSPRDVICAFVEHVGYPKVKGVSSASVALTELETQPNKYSCIITDINMPGINGKQLIETLRKHKRLQKIPIIVLTAYGTADNLVDCLKAGASGFLVKPPTKQDLNRELSRAIRISQEGSDPRLIVSNDVEALRAALIKKGFS